MDNKIRINKNGDLEVGGTALNLLEFEDSVSNKIHCHIRSTPPEDFKLIDFWYNPTTDILSVAKLINGAIMWMELPFGFTGSGSNIEGGNGVTLNEFRKGIEDLINRVNELNIRNTAGAVTDLTGNKLAYTTNEIDNRLVGLKNLLINGDFKVNQRGLSFSGTNRQFTSDRWISNGVKNVDVVLVNGMNELKITTDNGSSEPYILQIVENGISIISEDTYTISFLGRSNLDNYIKSISVNDESSSGGISGLKVKSSHISGYKEFSYTFKNDGSLKPGNMYVKINFKTSLPDKSLIYVKDIQLEIGDKRTPFDRRHISFEELLCFRYYYRLSFEGSYDIYEGTKPVGSDYFFTTSRTFPVTMRHNPTVNTSHARTYDNWGSTGDWDKFEVYALKYSYSIQLTGISTDDGKRVYVYIKDGNWIEFDAEL